jgi:hypothetical protein
MMGRNIHQSRGPQAQKKDGALFPVAGRFARIKKPVFNELHDNRAGQVSDEL